MWLIYMKFKDKLVKSMWNKWEQKLSIDVRIDWKESLKNFLEW